MSLCKLALICVLALAATTLAAPGGLRKEETETQDQAEAQAEVPDPVGEVAAESHETATQDEEKSVILVLTNHSDDFTELAKSGYYYKRYPNWNCYDRAAPSSEGFYGVRSISSCLAACSRQYSCKGVVYMNSQSKCWLRRGYCSFRHNPDYRQEASAFDYYRKLSR
eukprot:TRINITY_DN1862_c0_g1_i1.p1 TRINITY_DN1862_c0_g1~~TRINITY_DN1862_c0_g1_i1.p1  ORF type:complete len:187 (-),score=44.48 TRINITY_DN1862_c0_g1_i1:316-816(-)